MATMLTSLGGGRGVVQNGHGGGRGGQRGGKGEANGWTVDQSEESLSRCVMTERAKLMVVVIIVAPVPRVCMTACCWLQGVC